MWKSLGDSHGNLHEIVTFFCYAFSTNCNYVVITWGDPYKIITAPHTTRHSYTKPGQKDSLH